LVRSRVDEQVSSLPIAFPSPFIFARRVIDVRSENIDVRSENIRQHLFPI
jgi:hypothetical protein